MTQIADTGLPLATVQPAFQLTALDALSAAWVYRWLVLLCLTVALGCGIIYLHTATYRYTVALRLAPNGPDNSSLLSKLGGLASVAGLSLPTDKGSSPFDLYIEAIKSPDTADTLARDATTMHVVFADQWDGSTRQWHPATGVFYRLSLGIKSFLGLPVPEWHPPGGRELADFIDRRVMLVRDAKKSVATIQLTHENPRFAERFLLEMHQTIDSALRRRALARSQEYVAYMTNRLETTQVSENRIALATALAQEQRSLMVASAHSSYAADIFGGTEVSLTPTEPKVGVVLGLAAIVGVAVGVVLAMLRRRLRTRIILL